ncbi:MAG: hypothetical protein H0U74_07685 [Bradymonadaceae bacterium]|nr:hypothetical protein [Lujinxingiaceae bacterium]
MKCLGFATPLSGSSYAWIALLLSAALMMPACSDDARRAKSTPDVVDTTDPDASQGDDIVDQVDAVVDPPPVQPTTGPGKVLDVEAARELSRLGLQIRTAESNLISVASVQSQVYKIDFTFRSQSVFGTAWTHDATMFVPLVLNPSLVAGAFIVVQHGTQNDVKDISQTGEFRINYAARITAIFGIPSVVVTNLPGPIDLNKGPQEWQGQGAAACFGQSVPALRYTPCLLEVLRNTDDASADPFRYLAFGWMRAVTAAVEVSRRAPEQSWNGDGPIDFRLSRAIILADGDRAVGARMAAAVDTRIDGVFGAGADFGALSQLLPKMKAAWSQNYGWFGDVDAFRLWLQTDAGKAWHDTVDPMRWPVMIADKSFVNALGTKDPNFPLSAYALMALAFGPDTNRFVVANYGAGIGTQDHLLNWMAFATHVYLGRNWLNAKVTATPSGGNIAIAATAIGSAEARGSAMSYVQQHTRDDGDFRNAVWNTDFLASDGPMSWSGNHAPITQNSAAFVDVYEEDEVLTILEDVGVVPVAGTWSSPILVFD